jgi:serine phosphatase RsbU (regulator of sigma subunit)/pSer/pThr/pTyr-binding forkhead associated (FHA) protein
MYYLEIVDASGRRRRVELTRPRLLIGREPTCDICLPHPSVSRRHAQLQQTEQGLWMLQDLNSLNHVYLENRPVQQILLEPGLAVRIADYRLALMSSILAQTTERKTLPLDDSSAVWSVLDTNWLEHMQDFQRALLRLEEPKEVLGQLAREFHRISHPELVAVNIAVGGRHEWQAIVAGEDMTGDSFATPELLKRLSAEDSEVKTWAPGVADSDTPRTAGPSCLLFPMKGRGTILGHVYVQRPRLSPMPPAMQHYLALMATQAGLVCENLQLAALRLAQKVIEQELLQARQIQIELFPTTTDVDARLDAYAVNLPSVQVSGDYYDLVRTGRDMIAFVVADAMGHGLPAALMMAAVRASLRMGLALGLPWQAVFQGLDDLIAQARAGGAFVTGLVGQIDLSARRLDLVSAGHQLPSILVGDRAVVLAETCQTRPWGLDFDCPWQVGQVELGSEDWSVLCFTDGITEVLTKSGDIFGYGGVTGYHQQHHALCAEDLCQGLIGEVAARQSAGSLQDDQTVLVLRSNTQTERRSSPTRRMPSLPA